MKKTLFVMAGVGALLSTVVGASTIANNFWHGHVDMPLPSQPCGVEEKVVSMTPIERQGELWVFYVCHSLDGLRSSEWARVYLGQPIPSLHPTAPVAPTNSCSHIPGFVPTYEGSGCVPPNHPLARKGEL